MKKIAFVVQRYGLEVNGGAELECRQYAERMTKYYEVDIITTKAIDYITWKDEYTADEETINGVCVHRFSVDETRDFPAFNKLFDEVTKFQSSTEEEEDWMKKQGPYSTGLLRYLQENKDKYDVFLFCTYLYATTYYGLPIVKDKAILIPTAHDELTIYLHIFEDFFKLPKGFFYNTVIEQAFVERLFDCSGAVNNAGAGGVGIDVPTDVSGQRFRDKHGLDDFILYIGRIDRHKGCEELFNYFLHYKKKNPGRTKLVLIGKETFPIPQDKDILSLGFVEEQDKFDALAACRLLVLPSRFESLSMVVLEAMSVGKAVLVQGNCKVVKNHCLKSNGGLYYKNYFEFEGCLNYLLKNEDICKAMGENGSRYVEENYTWENIDEHLRDVIERVAVSQDIP